MSEEQIVKVSISMPKKLLMRAIRLAKERDTSVSGVVRAGLRLMFEAKGEKRGTVEEGAVV